METPETAPAGQPEKPARAKPASALVEQRRPELVVQFDKGYIVPRTIEEAHRFAAAVWKAGVVPASYNSQEEVMIGVMKALEVGLPPLTGLAWIMIVNNRPTIWGDGALALIHQSGQMTSYAVRQIGTKPVRADSLMTWPDDYGYEATFTRAGHAAPFVGRFTVADAKRAKLWLHPKKDPWLSYPDRMLMIRARSFPMRDGFADCLCGLSIYEEVADTEAAVEKPVIDAGDLFAERIDGASSSTPEGEGGK